MAIDSPLKTVHKKLFKINGLKKIEVAAPPGQSHLV